MGKGVLGEKDSVATFQIPYCSYRESESQWKSKFEDASSLFMNVNSTGSMVFGFYREWMKEAMKVSSI